MGLIKNIKSRLRPGAVVVPFRNSVTEHDGRKWVRIGGGLQYNRDIPETEIWELCNRAYRAYRLNPFVYRVTEMWKNFVIGSGLEFKAKDERAQPYLDGFIKNSRLQSRMEKRAREYYLFGELIGIDVTNVGTGNGRVSFVDPLIVSKIEYDQFDGDEAIAIVLRGADAQEIKLPIVREDLMGTAAIRMPEMYGDKRPGGFDKPLITLNRKVGRAFYLASNSIIGTSRGTSNTTPFLDWCGVTEDVCWEFSQSVKERNKNVGTITIKDATPKQLAKYRDPNSEEYIPYPGENGQEWNWISDKIAIGFVNPNIGASEFDIAFRLFKSMIEIGGGPPEHFFGEAAKMTYASAKDASSPFLQQVKSGQKEFTDFWKLVCEHRLDQIAIFSDNLNGVTDLSVDVIAPEISPEDSKYKAEVGRTLTDQIIAWRTSGGINDEQMIDLMGQVATIVGLKVKAVENLAGAGVTKQTWMQEALRRLDCKIGRE